jgi:hypothetical protein
MRRRGPEVRGQQSVEGLRLFCRLRAESTEQGLFFGVFLERSEESRVRKQDAQQNHF